jgi:hypothetical protein
MTETTQISRYASEADLAKVIDEAIREALNRPEVLADGGCHGASVRLLVPRHRQRDRSRRSRIEALPTP